MPWRREWKPTPVFLPGELHGQRSLVGCSLWDCKESDMTEWLTLSLSSLFINGLLSVRHHAHVLKRQLDCCPSACTGWLVSGPPQTPSSLGAQVPYIECHCTIGPPHSRALHPRVSDQVLCLQRVHSWLGEILPSLIIFPCLIRTWNSGSWCVSLHYQHQLPLETS